MMNSEEFGLVAAQQLLQCEDLHYGYWDNELPLNVGNLAAAQERHTEVLLEAVLKNVDKTARLLDVGCGIGTIMRRFLKEGFRVDGLVPSGWMAEKARENVNSCAKGGGQGEVYCCRFQDFDESQLKEQYDLVFFSESYQYITLSDGFEKLKKVLKPGAKVIIFDFFRKDGVEGKSPLGGGHSMREFYNLVKEYGFSIESDQDLTEYLSPNLRLISELLEHRLIPFGSTLDKFLASNYKIVYSIIKFLLRKNLREFRFKYSEERNQENFEKYKSYRLITLQVPS